MTLTQLRHSGWRLLWEVAPGGTWREKETGLQTQPMLPAGRQDFGRA